MAEGKGEEGRRLTHIHNLLITLFLLVWFVF